MFWEFSFSLIVTNIKDFSGFNEVDYLCDHARKKSSTTILNYHTKSIWEENLCMQCQHRVLKMMVQAPCWQRKFSGFDAGETNAVLLGSRMQTPRLSGCEQLKTKPAVRVSHSSAFVIAELLKMPVYSDKRTVNAKQIIKIEWIGSDTTVWDSVTCISSVEAVNWKTSPSKWCI